MYDAPAQLAGLGRFKSKLYIDAFGEDADRQRALSPIAYVQPGRDIPPFAVLHVARRADSTARSKTFVAALKQAGVDAVRIPGEDKTHRTINHELGTADDQPTQAIFAFLERQLNKSP